LRTFEGKEIDTTRIYFAFLHKVIEPKGSCYKLHKISKGCIICALPN